MILYVPHNTEKICHAYKSKHNLTRENQVFLLMITDGEKCHYLAVKELSALLRGTTSNHNEDFYCLNCFRAYTTENKLETRKKLRDGSTYDYHFIIKNLAEEFEGEFDCLGENTEKYITFLVPIKNEITKKDKIIKISYKTKFINSYRFMSTSLSKLVDNLSEGLHNDKCKDCKSYLDYMTTKDEKLIFRCFSCKKNYEKDFNKDVIQRFANIYEFCNGDLNIFVLLLRKGVYPYEYMDNWQRFNESSLPDKKAFYSNLNMNNITDVDYRHGKKIFKKFKLKHLGDYHDLHVQSDTLLLADVFENFRNTCIKVYELDLAHILSAPGLAWQACLKKTMIKLELLTDVDMLLMVEKGIRGGICHAIYRYAKANNKFMKNYNKDKEESFIQYLDAKNLYGWAISQ